MPRSPSRQPTDVELQILNVIWREGPSTVRQVHNHLLEVRKTGYSTTLKMMQVMTEKNLLIKDDSQRPQTFSASYTQEETQTNLVDNLIDQAFEGAANQLVMRAVSSKEISREELSEIKKLIQKMEKDSK